MCLSVALVVLAWRLDPAFLSLRVQEEIWSTVWGLALVASLGTLVVLTGGIDLSVGATMSLSAVVFGLSLQSGASLPVAGAAALVVGALCGLTNGLFVAKAGMHPLIVTLATMSVYGGLAEGVSQDRPMSGFPSGLSQWLTGATPFACTALVALGAAVWLARTVNGQAVAPCGMNETAVRLSGLPVTRLKATLYTLVGTGAGAAALFYAAKRNTVKADIGQGFELDVVTAIVLGGASVSGGRGSVWGTLLGVALVHEARQFVSWHWERDELAQVTVGALLIASLIVHTALAGRTPKWLRLRPDAT